MSVTEPMTAAEASRYQQLRSHLTTLKLTDAAEALPAVLDAAKAENLTVTAALERLLRIEVTTTEARRLSRTAPLRLPAHTRATLEDFDYDAQPGVDPAADQRPRLLPLPRNRDQRSDDRPARRRQDDARRRPGPQSRRSRLPHLLHHRRRPRRPLPPRRDRGPLGHHHAVLRRTDAAS